MIPSATPVSPTAPATPPGGAPAPPQWDAITDSVACPLCGYNLRGLVEPRCPECGYAFEWQALLDPARRLHPYLFEHHPERNVRSFVRTMVGGLLPRRFWRSLQPAQPSHVRRLLLYWLVAASLVFVASLTHAGLSLFGTIRENEISRAASIKSLPAALATPSAYQPHLNAEVQNAGGMQAWVDARLPPTRSRRFFDAWYRQYDLPMGLRVPAIFAGWPWLTFLTLMIFVASMRRAKVRPVHVLRCVVYSCDAGVWLIPLAAVTSFLNAAPTNPVAVQNGFARGGMVLVTIVLPAYTTWRLAVAYRLYLRFDHPMATVAAAQFIVALFMAAVLVNLPT